MSTDSSTGIQSAEIALDVLTRLAELGGAQSDVRTGPQPGHAARQGPSLPSLAGTARLCRAGPASARYRLGPQALHPGWPPWPRSISSKLAADGLDALSGAIGQTVFISIWGQHGPTIVSGATRLPVTVNVRVGSVLPCSTTPPAGSMPPGCRGPGLPAPWPNGTRSCARAPTRPGCWTRPSRRPIPPRPCARTGAPRAAQLRHGQRPSAARHRFGQRAGAGRPGRPGGRAHQPGAARRLRPVARRRPVRGLLAAAADCSRRLGWRA